MKLFSKIIPDSIDPIRTIEWVIAILTLVGGVYIFTPLYGMSLASNGLTPLATALSHPLMVLMFGALLVVSALLVLYGLWKNIPHIRSAGWFGIFMARSFQLLTTFLVSGFLPLTWIYPFTITLVVVILWGCARVEVLKNAHA